MKLQTAEGWVNNNTQEITERGIDLLQFTPVDSGILITAAKEAAKELATSNTGPDISLFRNNFWERYFRLLKGRREPSPELSICMEDGELVAVITSYEMVATPPQKMTKEKAA